MYYLIWLSILDFEPREKLELIKILGTPEKIFNYTENGLKEFTNSEKIIHKIINSTKRKQAEKIYEKTLAENIEIVGLFDSKYPYKLKNIYYAPIILYAKGNLNLLESEKTIAIVGSRNCSEYGRKITEKMSYMLAKKDYTIVSGMARGIDSYAHKGALIAQGKTIAVLGSGINYIYPKENEILYNTILEEQGLIISEYPLNMIPTPKCFPARNRIISGISDKVLVTEASQKSGSIITANFAIEQGKNVYAIPGNITSVKSEGTNELIKEGAFLVTTLEDIIDL